MGPISRRQFLEAAACATATGWLGPKGLAQAGSAGVTPAFVPTGRLLPWQREARLRDAARSAAIQRTLSPASPVPDVEAASHWLAKPQTLALTNPAIKSGLWGPSHRITVSLMKTDVHDRRVKWPKVVTLKEIVEGAYAPVNCDAVPVIENTTRAAPGYLLPSGGRSEPYAEAWHAYPFPCQKPVGQIILLLDDLDGAPAPVLSQSCASGLVHFAVERGGARAEAEIVLSMTTNVYGLRARRSGFSRPVRLRLHRRQDQGHLDYMKPDGEFRPPPRIMGPSSVRYEDDVAWNGPIDPPRSGRDGRFFWIAQRMPPEKTFPGGFHYVMMGLVAECPNPSIETASGIPGLGTVPVEGDIRGPLSANHPSDQAILRAPGAAATVTLPAGEPTTAYVTVVTDLDAPDIMAEARRRLLEAEAAGFEAILRANERWYGGLYDRREDGRIFFGSDGTEATEDVAEVFMSWYCRHEAGCKTDMRRYQATAPYSFLERDWQPWHGYPCYNDGIWEYATPACVRNRADAISMWEQIIEHWHQASRQNAREMFGMPGMALMHGYLPPIKADRYVHTNLGLELAMDTMGQVAKAVWDQWDYGGDPALLERLYPALRDIALFYAAYVRPGDDGYWHVIPTVEQERWGIFPRFTHSKDTTGSVCAIRWALGSAAEAAERLGRDADLRGRWRDLARRLLPYSLWPKPDGPVFTGARDVEPFWFPGDHEYYEGVFPTTLTGDLNLDSSMAWKSIMARTARTVQDATNAEALVLLGLCPDVVARVFPKDAPDEPIRDWKVLRAEVARYPERLLNSRGGRIHLFPCVPKGAEVAFHRFRARGAWLVSAARDRDGVYFLEIEARVDRSCALMNPWPGQRIAVGAVRAGRNAAFTIDRDNGECIRFEAEAGEVYRFAPIADGGSEAGSQPPDPGRGQAMPLDESPGGSVKAT